jgi:hypothetical protein
MNAVQQQEDRKELSPYLKAMVGEGLMRPEVAEVFARLDSQDKQRLAFKELKDAQVAMADEIVSKLSWTEWKRSPGVSPELGKRIWKNIRVFRALGRFLANVAVIPIGILLFLLSFMPWIEKVVLFPFRLVEYLAQPILDDSRGELKEQKHYALSQQVFCTLFLWAYLIALFWMAWRAVVWIYHLIF